MISEAMIADVQDDKSDGGMGGGRAALET